MTTSNRCFLLNCDTARSVFNSSSLIIMILKCFIFRFSTTSSTRSRKFNLSMHTVIFSCSCSVSANYCLGLDYILHCYNSENMKRRRTAMTESELNDRKTCHMPTWAVGRKKKKNNHISWYINYLYFANKFLNTDTIW